MVGPFLCRRGMMWADFSVKQASGVFALVNYVNQLRTGPNR